MNILFETLAVFGFALFMLAASFIRLQVRAGLREDYLRLQDAEKQARKNGNENGDAYGS
ncbi:hypothetical protein [Pseudochrobactrum sp. HB0163]|uniref:hypothetical protein n=1 Tax=Pseudochrobactrum sp. HB0163 TaxID=3450708 RepID=UPI003F6DF119